MKTPVASWNDRRPRKGKPLSDKTDLDPTDGVAPDVRDGPNLLPPRAAVAELIVLLALIVGIDWALPHVDATQLQPNPFWLPVLVLSLQYGTVSGLLAAASVIAIMLLGYPLPEQENGENLFTYAARSFSQPVLWIAAAVLLGQFRVRQIEAKRSLVRAVDILTRQRTSLSAYAQGLRARCDTLEREIVGRSGPPTLTALAALDALHADHSGDRSPSVALQKGLAAVFPGASGFVFDRSSGRPSIIASHGSTAGGRSDKALDALATTVIDRGQAIDILSREGEALLAGLGMAAVPIEIAAGPATGEAGRERIGVLVIDILQSGDIGTAMLPAARVLARAIAPALAAATPLASQAHSQSAQQAGQLQLASSAAIAPNLAVVLPLTAATAPRPLDVAKASRRWAKFGWMPGRAPDAGSTGTATAPPIKALPKAPHDTNDDYRSAVASPVAAKT